MVRYHAGVRLLCGVEGTAETIDHTSVEDFRNTVGPDGAEELNKLIVQHAMKWGFTGSRLCSSDTTVQEAPICHPTEVGHLRKISEELGGIGKRIKRGRERWMSGRESFQPRSESGPDRRLRSRRSSA